MTPKPWHKMLCPWLRGTSFCSSPPWGCCLQFYCPVASLGCCPGPIWILWINVAEMFVINYKCPFCMDDTHWKSLCVLDSHQIGEKYEVPSKRNLNDTLGGIDQFCSSFRGWDCQPEETAVLRRFLTFFGTGLTHLTHIYGYDMDILRRNRPQLSFPGRSEATNILVHPWEGLPPPTQLTNPNNMNQLSRAIH